MSVRSIVVVSVLSAFGLVGVGCGYSASDYCNDFCDCTGCNDNKLDDCVDDLEDSYDDAVDAGCEDQADDYLSCLGDEATCRDGNFDADGCEDEFADVAKCVQ